MPTDDTAPLVSVIVATYNWSSVLHYALLSVKSQTFQNFEVLVIGDGCTDDSAQIVNGMNDPRFRWENLAANSGHQSAPNNRGLQLARGKWVAYLGHDDLWMPNHLERLLSKLEESDVDVAFSLAMLIGAPGCDGRLVFPVFENGQYERGHDVPPSVLMHCRSLADQIGNWPDHRLTTGSPESALLAQFYDGGAKFAALPEVTVFKFPSSWRPDCYTAGRCDEQAEFFRRMQHEPGFLRRELTELALSTQLLKPHTTMPATPVEDNLRPGAVIEGYRRNRGLTAERPQSGAPRYVMTAALARMVDQLTNEEIQRRQSSRFAIFELFWAVNGEYSAGDSTRTLIPIGQWTRLRLPLDHRSDGAPLRIDPCERPALIEVASVALRRNGRVLWRARAGALDALVIAGDAFRLDRDRVLCLRSRGYDPMLFLPAEAEVEPPVIFEGWFRLTPVPL